MSNNFKKPDWCASPTDKQLYILQVLKDNDIVEVHPIRKGCFFFGRNSDQVDYVLNHASCSRVHAVLLFNPVVERFFLTDFSSANGSFIDNSKKAIEPNQHKYLPFDVSFSFGASTRSFRLVNSSGTSSNGASLQMGQSNDDKNSLTFDEETQRNTILNQKICVHDKNTQINTDNTIDSDSDNSKHFSKVMPILGRSKSVRFSETIDFINLHETDENIGQFGDLARTSFNPRKRKLTDGSENHSRKISNDTHDDNNHYDADDDIEGDEEK